MATTTEIRVLSIRQPFVDLILCGQKRIENRTWETKHRGPLWLHASRLEKKPTREALEEQCGRDLIEPTLKLWDAPGDGVTGAILGVVDLVEIITVDDLWILTQTPVGAASLKREESRLLYPSQREGYLERFRHVHPLIADMTEQEIELHGDGPFCWLLQNPKALAEPIPTGGKLNLWRFTVESDRLVFSEPEPPKQQKRSPGRRKK